MHDVFEVTCGAGPSSRIRFLTMTFDILYGSRAVHNAFQRTPSPAAAPRSTRRNPPAGRDLEHARNPAIRPSAPLHTSRSGPPALYRAARCETVVE